MTTRADVETAWRAFCDQLHDLGREMIAMEPSDDADRIAETLQFAVLSLRGGLDFRLANYDPRHPHITWWDRMTRGASPAAPNVDNSYVIAKIDGRETYRLTVPLKTIDEFNLSIHARYYGQESSGRQVAWGNVTLQELAHDGETVEVILSATPHEGNWLEIGEDAKFMFLRLYYFDWEKGSPPEVNLTCLSVTEPAPNIVPAANLIQGLADVIEWVRAYVHYEHTLAINGFLVRAEGRKNHYLPASYAGAPPAYRYGNVEFDLAPDEALVMEFTPPNGRYWIVQWHRLPWGDSADFFNHITSLNNHQAQVDADGKVRLVFAHDDPGVQNWISTEGRRTGFIYARWFWCDAAAEPVVSVVKTAEVRAALPADTPAFGAEARSRQMAIRRTHLERRY